MAEGDRDDLQQLDKAVRGRLLELQLLKQSAQCQSSQAQHAALLDVGSSTQPKVCSLTPPQGLSYSIVGVKLCIQLAKR